ncbi:MAG: 3-methyl-2-oxobutanoate hydroxymethyltransferase [Verrucomicrobia subdivision 3 bacterium]|nr:3-methyl-2-oxobutanoate hydroxymethyltransferase [Limisphaerales bacterium]MCS1414288.1 3-methyl-2-oxobutanoate hydroxymethyltransferase [Limisphaerales bacterium]
MIAGGVIEKVSIDKIRSFKGRERLPILTAYDYPMAKLLDELGMPMVLVGDSLGMVVLGYPDTTHVTMEDMLHHVRAVARAEPSALVVADLPYRSYDSVEAALANSRRLVEAGADAVKAEGGQAIHSQIKAIMESGIPFMGHIGMLPQHIKEEGCYQIKGKVEEEKERLIRDALLLDELGAFGMVLELVKPSVATGITDRIKGLTIGIGSGTECDGQILVSHDLVGGFPWFTPRFVKPKLNVSELIKEAIDRWRQEVRGPSAR